MKYARKRWLPVIAICLGLSTPAWSEPLVFPDEAMDEGRVTFEEGEATLKISDESASVRLGQSASGSIAQTQASAPPVLEPVPATPAPSPAMAPGAFSGPAQPMFPDAQRPMDEGLGFASMQREKEILWRFGRVNMDQYGYNGGYSNFNAFVPLFGSVDSSLFWVNPRITVTDYGMAAANIGVGNRFYDAGRDRVWGGSFWYDYDDGHQRSFNQLGGSFESIGQYFAWRGNFTVPVGEKSTKYNIVNQSAAFNGSSISILQSFNSQVALQQYDTEVTVPLPGLGAYGFDLGLGAYILNSPDTGSATGASVRTQAQITENFWMNGIYTYDHIFNSIFSLNFEWTVPNHAPSRWFRRAPVQTYMTQSVIRRYRVPVRTTTGTQTVTATQNGSALRVAFIDPNSVMGPGTGTQGNPFDSLSSYEASGNQSNFDMIYVLRNDTAGNAGDHNLDTGITLLDMQKLVGEGPNVFITTDQGSVRLQGTAGAAPTLSNAADLARNVVTLANGNEVTGFTIDAGNAQNGIDGSAGISGFNIHDNTIQNFINGINIVSDTSAASSTPYGVIKDNVLIGTNENANQYPSLAGINVVHNAGTLDLYIASNTISNVDEDANGNGKLDAETTSGVDEDFDGIIDVDEDLNGNGTQDGIGIRVLATNGTINAADPTSETRPTGIIGNTVTNSAAGIDVMAQSLAPAFTPTINLTFNGNTATGLTAPPSSELGAGFAFRLTSDASSNPGTSTMNLISFQNNQTQVHDGDGNVISRLNEGNGSIFRIVNNGTFLFNGASIDDVTVLNNDFGGNTGTGLLFDVVDSVVTIDSLSNLSVTGNTGDGLAINVTRSSNTTTSSLTVNSPITGAVVTGNGGDGLVITADNGAEVNMYFGQVNPDGSTTGNSFSNNGGNGLVLQALHTDSAITAGGVFNTALVGNTFSGNTLNGAQLVATGGTINFDGGPTNGLFTVDGVNVVSSGIVGVVGGSSTDQTSTQNFTGNGENGLAMLATSGGTISVPFMNGTFFDNNTGAGLMIGSDPSVLAPTASTVEILTGSNNHFNRTTSGTSGILFDTNNVNVSLSLGRNQFIGAGSGDTAFGIGGVIHDGGLTLNLVSGSTNNQNVFQNNVGAHVGIIMEGASNNTVNIANGSFISAQNDTDDTDEFNGDGVALVVDDTAQLTGSVVNSTFTTNDGDGLKLMISGNNVAGNIPPAGSSAINNFVIDGNSTTSNGLPVTSSNPDGGSGIAVIRTGRGQINNMQIKNNISTNNTRSGLFISSGNASVANLPNGADFFNITNNTFSNNGNLIPDNLTGNGIEFQLIADADILANIDNNLIENNTNDGILAWERVNSAGDSRTLTGNWTRNIIRNNNDDGIDFRTNAGDPFFPALIGPGLVIGDATPNAIGTLSGQGNLITLNGRDGIDITGGGKITIGNNEISLNGRLTQTTTAGQSNYYLGVAGININGPYFENGDVAGIYNITNFGPFQDVTIVSNIIEKNQGDGIQWIAEPGVDNVNFFQASQMTVQNNLISKNWGRGIDMLMRPGDADLTDTDNTDPDQPRIANLIGDPGSNLTTPLIAGGVTIDNNQIVGNKQEGVYLVATNATNQGAAVISSTLLSSTGAVNASYFLDFNFTNNQVIGNGNSVIDFPATGLVMRIGTTGGGYGYTDDGGFASDGYGGVIANISGNYFTGNEGDDILIHSFVSTVDPTTTSGTWTTPPPATGVNFQINSYQGDPLARLDLIFNNNTFDSATFNNGDTTITTTIGTGGAIVAGEPGAYYDNAEGTFKSRTVNTGGNTGAGGPFNNSNGATRRRNATRQAARIIDGIQLPPRDPPFSNDHPEFLFAGMGASTFRVQNSGNFYTNGVAADTPTLFIMDSAGYPTSGSPNGTPFTPLTTYGELPFGWGTF